MLFLRYRPEIKVNQIRISQRRSSTICSSVVSVERQRHPVWFEWKGAPPLCPADAFAAAFVRTAMRRGLPLLVEDPVSAGFLEAIEGIQSVYSSWDPALQRIEVCAREETASFNSGPVPRNCGLFFTGGADSFHSLFQSVDDFDSLVFVHGFDLPLRRRLQFRLISRPLRNVAADLKKTFQLVRTNLREVLDRCGGSWEMDHGAALAAVGLMLSGDLQEVSISSSTVKSALRPWGTHPDLDPRFSTQYLKFHHRGIEASRFQKIEAISRHPVTWDSLRVCWKNVRGKYNCGACDKCVRTAVALEILGALKNYRTLPFPLDLQRVCHPPNKPNELRFIQQNLAAAIERQADAQLIEALQQSLSDDLHAHRAA